MSDREVFASAPAAASRAERHYATVAAAIAYLCEHAERQPELEELAAAVHLSPFHFQRLFSAWAGVSPKRFLQFLTKEHARRLLAARGDVLSTAAAVGLSGGGRLHDLLVSCEAMTPGDIQAAGAGLQIAHGFAASPFGSVLIGWTPRGICHLAFAEAAAPVLLDELRAAWPQAEFRPDAAGAAALAARVFAAGANERPLHLLLRGTNFQIKVWEALLRSAPGQLQSYGQLARRIGAPGAARAVGSACAANRIAYLIPCHRVIRESGISGPYRWGAARKLALHGWEAARVEQRGA